MLPNMLRFVVPIAGLVVAVKILRELHNRARCNETEEEHESEDHAGEQESPEVHEEECISSESSQTQAFGGSLTLVNPLSATILSCVSGASSASDHDRTFVNSSDIAVEEPCVQEAEAPRDIDNSDSILGSSSDMDDSRDPGALCDKIPAEPITTISPLGSVETVTSMKVEARNPHLPIGVESANAESASTAPQSSPVDSSEVPSRVSNTLAGHSDGTCHPAVSTGSDEQDEQIANESHRDPDIAGVMVDEALVDGLCTAMVNHLRRKRCITDVFARADGIDGLPEGEHGMIKALITSGKLFPVKGWKKAQRRAHNSRVRKLARAMGVPEEQAMPWAQK